MFTLQEFGELRCLWLIFTQDIKSCYHYIEKDGKRCMTNIDPKRTRQCRKRAIAVENALKCLIAKYPSAILAAFVCPTVSVLHYEALTRHDRA